MTEEWCPVPGFPNVEASPLGRVRFCGLPAPTKLWGVYEYVYIPASVSAVKYRRTQSVHALVARAFLGERPARHAVDHVDGNPQNNRLDNLEYVTYSENMRRGWAMRRSTQSS